MAFRMEYMKIPHYAFEVFVEKFGGFDQPTRQTNAEIAKNRTDLTLKQITKASAQLKEFFYYSHRPAIYFLADKDLLRLDEIYLTYDGRIVTDKRNKVRNAKKLYIIRIYVIPDNSILSKIDKNKPIFEFVELNI